MRREAAAVTCTVCRRPGFARWHYHHSGYIGVLCRGHLNIWLDNADNEPALEPTRLDFLLTPTAQ